MLLLGRHVLVLPRHAPLASKLAGTSHTHKVLVGIGRMFTLFPYWDVSWLIGICFTFGCLIFVACGLFYWLPIAYPETEFPHESSVAGGVTSFVGATLFQVGAVLLFLEAYNDRAETQFGGALESLFVDRLKLGRRSRNHRPNHFEIGAEPIEQQPEDEGTSRSSADSPKQESPPPNGDDKDTFTERQWKWLPSWHDVKTHYIYEIGFLASLTMSIGATIFYVCGILALPGVFDKLSDGVLDGIYYFCYLLGGVLFAISSLMYILETQPNWYTPQPLKIGWHIGVFNMIGGVGWTIAASFGYCRSSDWCEYQSQLTLIWASAAFSIGSAIQWYESLDKYVIIIED